MLSADYVRTLEGDPDCIAALAYCAEHAGRYPPGKFTPPLTHKKAEADPKCIIGMALRLGRKNREKIAARISRVDTFDGTESCSATGTDAEIAARLARSCFRSSTAGAMYVTSGQRRNALDAFLSSLGRSLLSLGYSLYPCISGGSVSFIDIRRGHRKWTITYLETATGSPPDTTLALAQVAASELRNPALASRNLYRAGAAYSTWLLNEFGVAMRPTVGMSAMLIARRHLPADAQKWRPVPLLVAMERIGIGYRAGMTYARRYRGRSWKIDVNRQYTHALRSELPLRVAFGAYGSEQESPHGVFMCRVWAPRTIHYPLGVWRGPDSGFEYVRFFRDGVVCVLHTTEFRALRAFGCTVTPSYGYRFTGTFTLGRYVERLQDIVDKGGKQSPEGILCKPLGNYIYGKFAQQPTRVELMYMAGAAPVEWHPYFDQDGKEWPEVWERKVTRHTASQHVDIGASITAAARAQTSLMWGWLSALGATVVRCHTDSLTLDTDPATLVALSDQSIGSWRLESESADSIIVGANAYFDVDGAHIAGVTEPTYEMVERAYDGQTVVIVQDENAPRRGWDRERRQRTKPLRATAL